MCWLRSGVLTLDHQLMFWIKYLFNVGIMTLFSYSSTNQIFIQGYHTLFSMESVHTFMSTSPKYISIFIYICIYLQYAIYICIYMQILRNRVMNEHEETFLSFLNIVAHIWIRADSSQTERCIHEFQHMIRRLWELFYRRTMAVSHTTYLNLDICQFVNIQQGAAGNHRS